MIGNKLSFKEFQEKHPVDPGDDQLQSDMKQAIRMGVAESLDGFHPTDDIQRVELINGVFQKGAGVASPFRFPLNDFPAFVLGFSEPDDVKELRVKGFVQAIAVIGERELQEVLG